MLGVDVGLFPELPESNNHVELRLSNWQKVYQLATIACL